MTIKANHIFFLLIMTLCFSCKSRKLLLSKDTSEIINITLEGNDTTFLIRKTFYNEKAVKQINLLNPYYRAYNSEKNTAAYEMLYRKVLNIISISELDKIKEVHTMWSIKSWDKKNIENSKVILVSLDSMEKYNGSIPVIRISEPLFTKDKKKAIIYRSYLKNKTGGFGIQILAKNNGKWKIKGSIPIGTSG